MISEAIRGRLRARPFTPFELRLGGGDVFVVRHPELATVSPSGRRMILWTGSESTIDLDVLLIKSLREVEGDPPAGTNGSGDRH